LSYLLSRPPLSFLSASAHRRALPSFPTRRSSDLRRCRVGRHRRRYLKGCRFEALSQCRRGLAAIAINKRHIDFLAAAHGKLFLQDRKSTRELQSRENLVCRLLLEKKKTKNKE